MGITHLSCGCHMVSHGAGCSFCRNEPDISPRPKSPVAGHRGQARDEPDGVNSDMPMRSFSTPAPYMSMDILRAEIEAVSGGYGRWWWCSVHHTYTSDCLYSMNVCCLEDVCLYVRI